MEDPSQREALLLLIENTDGTIIIVEADPDTGFVVSACDSQRDPISWTQSVSDIATRVAVTWKQQGVDDEGKPTTKDVKEQVVNAPLELQHGTRSVSVSTELQSSADALSVASLRSC